MGVRVDRENRQSVKGVTLNALFCSTMLYLPVNQVGSSVGAVDVILHGRTLQNISDAATSVCQTYPTCQQLRVPGIHFCPLQSCLGHMQCLLLLSAHNANLSWLPFAGAQQGVCTSGREDWARTLALVDQGLLYVGTNMGRLQRVWLPDDCSGQQEEQWEHLWDDGRAEPLVCLAVRVHPSAHLLPHPCEPLDAEAAHAEIPKIQFLLAQTDLVPCVLGPEKPLMLAAGC
jgi:hypothetical protein